MRVVIVSLAALFAFGPSTAVASGNGHAAPTPPTGSVKAFDISNLDTTCKPCDDFNKYANGGWVSRNPIPGEYPSWSTGAMLRDRTLDQLHGILEKASKSGAAKGSVDQKVGDYYFSVMNTALSDSEGVKPIAGELARIESIRDAEGLRGAIVRIHQLNVDAVFGVGAFPDFKKSDINIGFVGQGGLGLPERDYYFKDDEKSRQIREAYLRHVAKTFELAGDGSSAAAANAKAVLALETRFAGASLTNVELRDPNTSYRPMTAEERKALTPHFAWEKYFTELGYPSLAAATVNMAHPKFLAEFDKMIGEVPLADWKTYLRWRLVDEFSATLSTAFVDENFEFNERVLKGATEQSPRWKIAVRATDGAMGDLVGQAYVREYFSPESKVRVRTMVRNLAAALRESIMKLDWIEDVTRKQALAKLDAFVDRIGYPDKWKDYSNLSVDRGPYASNALRVREFAFRQQMNKAGKSVDLTEWNMSAPTVNASYNPFRNFITFPAGILQPPFFNPEADDAINYGAIGAVIGHEMTHGFDDSGARFDAQGNLKNWWSEKDLQNFEGRAKCVVDQFDAFTIGDGTHLKGKLVSGESIADLGGLLIAYRAYMKSIEGKPRPANVDGFTPEQRFFLGYAQVWAAHAKPQFERFYTETNEHPLPRFRLNGTLVNMPEFRQAFGCKAGDGMVKADAQRCEIWQ
jgi:putative endopeptidase